MTSQDRRSILIINTLTHLNPQGIKSSNKHVKLGHHDRETFSHKGNHNRYQEYYQ